MASARSRSSLPLASPLRQRDEQLIRVDLDPIVGAELADIKLGRVLRDLLRVLRSQGLMLPADLAVLVKTLRERTDSLLAG